MCSMLYDTYSITCSSKFPMTWSTTYSTICSMTSSTTYIPTCYTTYIPMCSSPYLPKLKYPAHTQEQPVPAWWRTRTCYILWVLEEDTPVEVAGNDGSKRSKEDNNRNTDNQVTPGILLHSCVSHHRSPVETWMRYSCRSAWKRTLDANVKSY